MQISVLGFVILQNLVPLYLEIATKFHQHNFSSQTTKSQKTSHQNNGTKFK